MQANENEEEVPAPARLDDFANVSSISKKPNKTEGKTKRGSGVLPTIEPAPGALNKSKAGLLPPIKGAIADNNKLANVSRTGHLPHQQDSSKLVGKKEAKSIEMGPQDLEQRNDHPLCVF